MCIIHIYVFVYMKYDYAKKIIFFILNRFKTWKCLTLEQFKMVKCFKCSKCFNVSKYLQVLNTFSVVSWTFSIVFSVKNLQHLMVFNTFKCSITGHKTCVIHDFDNLWLFSSTSIGVSMAPNQIETNFSGYNTAPRASPEI